MTVVVGSYGSRDSGNELLGEVLLVKSSPGLLGVLQVSGSPLSIGATYGVVVGARCGLVGSSGSPEKGSHTAISVRKPPSISR